MLFILAIDSIQKSGVISRADCAALNRFAHTGGGVGNGGVFVRSEGWANFGADSGARKHVDPFFVAFRLPEPLQEMMIYYGQQGYQ